MGLEGSVSKRRDHLAGRSKHWIKFKNRKHPAMNRVMEALCDDSMRPIQLAAFGLAFFQRGSLIGICGAAGSTIGGLSSDE